MPQKSKADTGRLGEALAAYYLERSGYTILRRNWRIKGGEIDIIAEKDGIIAFVEVRTRDAEAFAPGAQTVGSRKKMLVIRAAQEYSYRNPHDLQPRFDIAEVTVKNGRAVRLRYFDNAFDAGETDYIL